MDEKCGREPGRDCPMESRIATLERRVENNERKSSQTHEEFYDRVRTLETNAAVRSEQYDTILDKLENLTGTVGSLAKSLSDIQTEPGRDWKDLKGKIVWAVVGGVIMALLAALLSLIGL